MPAPNDRDEYSLVLSDVSLMPDFFGISVVSVGALAMICLVLLWPAFFFPNLLVPLLGLDVLLLIAVGIGMIITPGSMTFREWQSSIVRERAGQPVLVREPATIDREVDTDEQDDETGDSEPADESDRQQTDDEQPQTTTIEIDRSYDRESFT